MPDTETPFQLKYCRICAGELATTTGGIVSIFGEEGKRLRISEKIRKTLAVLVLEEDQLPKIVCTDCCTILEDFTQYKETCLDAQEKLKAIARNLTISKSNNTGAGTICKECGKKFSTVGGLEIHQQKEHGSGGDDAVEEPLGSQEKNEEEEVVTSEKVTEPPNHESQVPVKPFSCPSSSCSASFKDKKGLTQHSFTHATLTRPFACSYCQKFYKTSKCLAKHVNSSHLSVGKFVCQICNKGFSRNSRLEEHKNIHFPSRADSCPFCPKKFNSYPNYLKHVRKIHEEKCVSGEKVPPPIRNYSNDSETPVPAVELTTQVMSGTAPEPLDSSPSKLQPTYHGVEMVSVGIHSSGVVTTDDSRGMIQVHHDPNQPMELCYKLANSDFQDMPMELTKVFQDSGSRTDHVTDLSQLIDLTSANPKESQNFNARLDMIDLSGFQQQQQPMDLINRDSCNMSSMNNSMDLSLRSSFSDQSTSSFIRELLDLSSRSEYHHHEPSHHPTELNLSSSKTHRGVFHPNSTHLNVYSDTLFSLTNQN